VTPVPAGPDGGPGLAPRPARVGRSKSGDGPAGGQGPGGDDRRFDPVSFVLPRHLEASEPPEARGLRRDGVRLMVARRSDGELHHRYFSDLPAVLQPGDVLAVNTSATLPASVPALAANGEPAAVHMSGRLPGGLWVIELRHRVVGADPGHPRETTTPWLDAPPGLTAQLPGGGTVELRMPLSSNVAARLWVAAVDLPQPLLSYLARHGRPIRYSYVPKAWPISSYQTVFAEVPGSAEMPSAARPFSTEVTTRLVARGVTVVPFVLHCGVSSLESHEPPAPEWYRVPPMTATQINLARHTGGRVIAVGTTAVRAIETVAEPDGTVHPGEGWTEVVIGPNRPVRAVDGLVTGWHEPGASHLSLLEAIAGPPLVMASYSEALAQGYLWHEFGDSHLVLP
jgi:S-adenosylmethionine:tRNA ribosyltransferase-isomerase